MEIEVRVVIRCGVPKSGLGSAFVSAEVLSKISDMCRIAGIETDLSPGRLTIECPYYLPILREIVQLIESEGIELVYDQRGHVSIKQVRIKYSRIYRSMELDRFEFLSVGCWGGMIYYAAGRDGARWLAVSTDEEREDGRARPATTCVNGHMEGGGNYFVREEVWRKMVSAGFACDFYELKGSDGPLMVPFYEIVPRKVTPPCLLDVYHDGCRKWYDEGPFVPAELQFPATFGPMMQGLDLAFTSEDFGDASFGLVVSQKFRQFCLNNGIEATFSPIFITDKLVQRWSPI